MDFLKGSAVMIKKYVYGTPFPTDAVVFDVQPSTDALSFSESE